MDTLCSTERLEMPGYFEIEVALVWNQAGHWVMAERQNTSDAVAEIEGSDQIRTTSLKIRVPKPEPTETIVHVRNTDTQPLSFTASGVPKIGLVLDDGAPVDSDH